MSSLSKRLSGHSRRAAWERLLKWRHQITEMESWAFPWQRIAREGADPRGAFVGISVAVIWARLSLVHIARSWMSLEGFDDFLTLPKF